MVSPERSQQARGVRAVRSVGCAARAGALAHAPLHGALSPARPHRTLARFNRRPPHLAAGADRPSGPPPPATTTAAPLRGPPAARAAPVRGAGHRRRRRRGRARPLPPPAASPPPAAPGGAPSPSSGAPPPTRSMPPSPPHPHPHVPGVHALPRALLSARPRAATARRNALPQLWGGVAGTRADASPAETTERGARVRPAAVPGGGAFFCARFRPIFGEQENKTMTKKSAASACTHQWEEEEGEGGEGPPARRAAPRRAAPGVSARRVPAQLRGEEPALARAPVSAARTRARERERGREGGTGEGGEVEPARGGLWLWLWLWRRAGWVHAAGQQLGRRARSSAREDEWEGRAWCAPRVPGRARARARAQAGCGSALPRVRAAGGTG